jgi:hypothetical protein
MAGECHCEARATVVSLHLDRVQRVKAGIAGLEGLIDGTSGYQRVKGNDLNLSINM